MNNEWRFYFEALLKIETLDWRMGSEEEEVGSSAVG